MVVRKDQVLFFHTVRAKVKLYKLSQDLKRILKQTTIGKEIDASVC
jgi:hypothetical protein